LLEKCYFPDFGFVTSREFLGRDVAGEDLNTAVMIADVRQRYKVKHPRACPGADVNDPRDMSGVDPGREELRIVEYAFVKEML
jgi:hypothetical protein